MAEVLISDDIEAALVPYLKDGLGVPVVTKVPHQRPVEFVRIARLGGNRRIMIQDQATIGVWAWAATYERASLLGRLAEGLIFGLEGMRLGQSFVYYVTSIVGPTMTNDPDTDTPLVLFNAQITWRLLPA